MAKKYIVKLTEDERAALTSVIGKGTAAAQRIKHANVLLKIDADGLGWSDEQAAEAFDCSPRTVFSIRQRFVEQGLETALNRKLRAHPARAARLDGAQQARLVQIACSEPPAGAARWTLKLLAEELVALEIVDTISPTTVMRALKKTHCNRIVASAG